MKTYAIDNAECKIGDFSLSISNCVIEQGRIYPVVGPNGSGKSSFLNLLALLAPPQRGRMAFNGQDIRFDDKNTLLASRRKIAYLTQNPYLFNATVFENIAYGLKVRGVKAPEIRERVESITRRLDLVHLTRRNAHRLSGGEAQRVALARALVLDCQVLLLDEPTANVDRPNIHVLEKTLLEICRERNATVVLTTHSHDQACRMSHEVISMIGGRIRDVAYENVFEGSVLRRHDGQLGISVAEGVMFSVAAGEPGERMTVSIAPEDIILSKVPLESSALNSFSGAITKVEALSDRRQLVFIDAGVLLCSMVTSKSFEGMGLGVGKNVWATFKASAVRML